MNSLPVSGPKGIVTCLFVRGSTVGQLLAENLSEKGARDCEVGPHGLIAWFATSSSAIATAIATFAAGDQIAAGIATGEASSEFHHLRLTEEARGLAGLADYGHILINLAAQELARLVIDSDTTFTDLGTRPLTTTGGPVRAFAVSHPNLPKTVPIGASKRPWFGARFVGRRQEIEDLSTAMAESRLVSIVGPAGIGKSALAARLELEKQDEFTGGTYWVDLKLASRPLLLVHRVAQALEISSTEETTLFDQITRKLGDREVLLTLDGADLIPDAASQFSEQLLQRCPNVAIVLTAARKLNLTIERVFLLKGLEIPSPGERLSTAVQYDAIQFLEQEAAAVEPSFAVTEENLEAVRGIAEIVEGSPWALEMAASRMSVLSPEQVLARLKDDPLTVLQDRSGGDRTRGLQASLSANLALANPWAQVLFRRLSIFSGPFDIDAADQVCSFGTVLPRPVIQAALRELHSLYLVRTWTSARSTRAFYMSGIAKEFAVQLARDAGEHAELVKSREKYISERIKEAIAAIETGRAAALAKFDLVYEDVRDNWLRVLRSKKSNDALDAIISVAPYWFQRGYYGEALGILDRVLEARDIDRSPSFGRFLVMATWVALRVNHHKLAETYVRMSIRRAIEDGSDSNLARALNAAAGLATESGRDRTARRLFQYSLKLCDGNLDQRTIRTIRMNLAITIERLGDLLTAERQLLCLWEESQRDGWADLQLVNNIAHLELVQGKYNECWDWLEKAADQYPFTPDPNLLGQAYATAAWAAAEAGELEVAGTLYRAYTDILDRYGLELSPRRRDTKEKLEWILGDSIAHESTWREDEPTALILLSASKTRKK